MFHNVGLAENTVITPISIELVGRVVPWTLPFWGVFGIPNFQTHLKWLTTAYGLQSSIPYWVTMGFNADL